MGEIKAPVPVKLICGVLYRDPRAWVRAAGHLQDRFGPLDYESEEFPFIETDYYIREMGPGIRRRYVSFRDLVRPDILVQAKHFTNDLETRQADSEGRRLVNLDPGIISASNLILASTKSYSHRIYLHDGIYAEVTMIFQKGQFQVLPWTYPDYRNHRDVFLEIRRIYRQQMRARSATE